MVRGRNDALGKVGATCTCLCGAGAIERMKFERFSVRGRSNVASEHTIEVSSRETGAI